MLDSFALDIPLGEPESPVPRVVTRSDQIRLNPIKAKQARGCASLHVQILNWTWRTTFERTHQFLC
jgi:hypothetical protein